MPQFTQFPHLPPGEYRAGVDAFLGALRAMPIEGEPFRDLRTRLKKVGMWSRERLPALLRFLRLAHSDPVKPSPLVATLIEAPGLDAAKAVMAERLWAINPLLFKVVIDRLAERVHSENEVLKFVDSFAYPGARITGPEVRAWVHLAQGLELLKPVGIRLTLTKAAAPFVEKAKLFDVDEFLDEDEDEAAPEAPPASAAPASAPPAAAPAPATGPAPTAPAGPALAAPSPSAAPPPPASTLPSPLGRGRPVSPARFAGRPTFPDDVLDVTVERIGGWWGEQSAPDEGPGPADFGLDRERYAEDPGGTLYRLAVAAALHFRLGRPPTDTRRAFDELERCGVLEALHDGSVPDISPAPTDAQALMLASLVARRLAEAPDLSLELERADAAPAAFDVLSAALGRGLFGVELFWIMAGLATLGVVPKRGLEGYRAVPDRGVRDTLFRLGALPSPYAADAAGLATAAAAAHRVVPGGAHPDRALRAFAAAAGCAYRCPHRRRCDLPCRERADLGG